MLSSEDGFLMIELIAAMLIISIALLALIGAYSLGYFAINSSDQTTSAGLLANNQLELYASLPYASIGLDSTTLATVKSSDANYNTDENALPVSGTDVTISGCGAIRPVLARSDDHGRRSQDVQARDVHPAAQQPERVGPDGEDRHGRRPRRDAPARRS